MKKTVIALFIVIIPLSYFLLGYLPSKGLKNFYNLTKEDPLFYSSFFDSEGWKRSLENLKNSENELKKELIEIYPVKFTKATVEEKNIYISTLQKNSLFPHQLLKDLISINKKTNEFLKNPSQKLGKELLSLYDNAADAYIQNAQEKINILENAKSSRKTTWPIYFFFIDSASNSEIVGNDLRTIKENGLELKKEIAQRKKCLSGWESCEAQPENNNKLKILIDSLNAKFDPKEDKIDNIKDLFLHSVPLPIKGVAKGPYEITSSCWQSANSKHWMYILSFQEENRKVVVFPKMATRNYYHIYPSISSGKNTTIVFFQPETTAYECLDLTFYPQLITLDFLNDKIKSGKITKKDLEKNSDYKLLAENQFGLLSPAISSIALQLNSLKLLTSSDDAGGISTAFLFSVRSDYSMFFFPFAKSVWRIDKKPQYFLPLNENIYKQLSTVTTQDRLEKFGYSNEEIKEINQNRITKDFIKSIFTPMSP